MLYNICYITLAYVIHMRRRQPEGLVRTWNQIVTDSAGAAAGAEAVSGSDSDSH